MPAPTLTLRIDDPAALRALFEEQLARRRVFVPGADFAAVSPGPCELVIEHAQDAHRVAGEVVYVRVEEPGQGVGVSLVSLDAERLESLRVFVMDASTGRLEKDAEEAADDNEGEAPSAAGASPRSIDKLRGLSSAEQLRMAATAGLSDRISLERMYGPNVWETLLRNPRLTIPEVARIARKGTLPRPLVDVIVATASWLATPEVQRALLSNPRSSAAVVTRILHALPRTELARVPQQTAYPMTVRAAAKKLLGTER